MKEERKEGGRKGREGKGNRQADREASAFHITAACLILFLNNGSRNSFLFVFYLS